MANLGMPTRFTSAWIIALTAVGLIGWDLYAAVSPTQPTLSAVVLHYAHKYMLIPFAGGVLSGHFFWPQQIGPETPIEEKP